MVLDGMIHMVNLSFNRMFLKSSPHCVLSSDAWECGFFPGMMPDTLCFVR